MTETKLPRVTGVGRWTESYGKWLDKSVFDNFDNENNGNVIEEWQSARCSNCGKYHTTPYMYYFENYKFCPNCGIPMSKTE